MERTIGSVALRRAPKRGVGQKPGIAWVNNSGIGWVSFSETGGSKTREAGKKTMTKKFNPKTHLGKDRIFVSVPHAPRITRIWLWDSKHREYRVPEKQKSFMARRWEMNSRSEKKRSYRCFWTLEEARAWQGGEENSSKSPGSLAFPTIKHGPIFRDIVEEWKRRCFPGIEVSTQISYTNLLRLYFGKLMDLSIYEITPEQIDGWLDDLKASDSWTMQSKKRTTFKNELKLLTTIMNYYGDYHDKDQEFRFPLKKRHRKLTKLNRRKIRPKDIKQDFPRVDRAKS